MRLKKILSISLCICFLLCSLVCFTSYSVSGSVQSEDVYWDDLVADDEQPTEVSSGSGVYEISNARQLAYFNKNLQNYVCATIKLTGDIYLSEAYWSANTSYKFKGLFDGNYHTIYDLTTNGNNGLFATIDYGGQVQNLTMRSCDFCNVTGKAGVICGYLEGASGKEYNFKNIIVKNAYFYYKQNNNNTVQIGGLAGFSYSSIIKNCMVYNMYAHAEYTSAWDYPGTTIIGGIVGDCNNTQISVCSYESVNPIYSLATSEKEGNGTAYCGGIVGWLHYANSPSTTKIEKCYAKGTSTILAGNVTATVNAYAGGIVGKLDYGSVENCFNTSKVEAHAKTVTEAAESIGDYGLTTTALYNNIYICSALKKDGGEGDYENVIQDSTKQKSYANCYAGGIVGFMSADTSVSYCYGAGTVESDGMSKNVYTFATKYYYDDIRDDYDYPIKTFTANIGCYFKDKIAGYVTAGATTTNCYSSTTFSSGYGNFVTGTRVKVRFTRTVIAVLNVKCYVYLTHSGDMFKIHARSSDLGTDLGKEFFSYTMSRPITFIANPITSTTVADIATANSSVWAIDSSLNGGNPIIKDFYWQY